MFLSVYASFVLLIYIFIFSRQSLSLATQFFSPMWAVARSSERRVLMVNLAIACHFLLQLEKSNKKGKWGIGIYYNSGKSKFIIQSIFNLYRQAFNIFHICSLRNNSRNFYTVHGKKFAKSEKRRSISCLEFLRCFWRDVTFFSCFVAESVNWESSF